jgi:integrase-like protein
MGKLIRAVLRGRNGGNTVLLPDKYEDHGVARKLYGFSAILCYSRMRFTIFVKRCDVQTLIRCLMAAFEYFGGLPKAALTDRMKSVLLDMEEKQPRWNALFADFMASIGVAPRVCKAYTPQTKGKIERTIGFVKKNFWPGVSFTDIDDLNRQATSWCERINTRVHGTTHERPSERIVQEPLAPLPQAFAWERFATEERHPSGGMAISPTMACCTACPLPHRWPVPWSRCGSGMGRSRCGRRDS